MSIPTWFIKTTTGFYTTFIQGENVGFNQQRMYCAATLYTSDVWTTVVTYKLNSVCIYKVLL